MLKNQATHVLQVVNKIMKLSQQFFILCVMGALLFFARDDAMRVYQKLQAYVMNQALQTQMPTTGEKVSVTTQEVATIPEKAAETPGALKKVKEDLLVNNSFDTVLDMKKVIALTNQARRVNGNLKPLKENSMLDNSAEKKLQDMFVKQYFEHVSPDGVGVADLGKNFGYEYIVIGENLALGNFKDDASLVEAWMESPGHRANILNTKYTEIGVSVGKAQYKGQEVWMAVQHFGLPKSTCPAIDPVLHGIIDIGQNDIKKMEARLILQKEHIDSGAVYDGKTTNEQIDEYNLLVPQFNDLIISTKEKITAFNDQVHEYNACIELNTSTEGSTH
jgi:uncharacterized protein YkwD